MELDDLLRRYDRLRHELSRAYNARPWHSQRIDELAEQLVETEREISTLHGAVSVVPAPRFRPRRDALAPR